jgi:two-component system NtrC family sensor kinase
LIHQALGLIEHAARAGGVSVVERYDEAAIPVSVDPSQLMQVFVNLTLNAIQAMPAGGTLRIEAGTQNGEAAIRFQDSGSGIAAADLDQIFEPFFTTKEGEEGTGLGLPVCRTLVAQHGGRITVESEPDQGSTFTVWLPLARMEERAVVG